MDAARQGYDTATSRDGYGQARDYSSLPSTGGTPTANGGSQYAPPQSNQQTPSSGLRRSSTPWRPGSTGDYPAGGASTGYQGTRTSYRTTLEPGKAAQDAGGPMMLAVGDTSQFPLFLR